METTPAPSAVIITYGELTGPIIRTIIVEGLDQARELAREFIQVFPDDLETYADGISSWTGESALTITHQDDDTFFFSAAPVHGCFVDPTEDLTVFKEFVADYNAQD